MRLAVLSLVTVLSLSWYIPTKAEDPPRTASNSESKPLPPVGTDSGSPKKVRTYKYPPNVTRFDIATRQDLFYARMVQPLIEGDDTSRWELLAQAKKAFKGTIGDVFDASIIAETITPSMPIEPAERGSD
jgi:hypothetical protein